MSFLFISFTALLASAGSAIKAVNCEVSLIKEVPVLTSVVKAPIQTSSKVKVTSGVPVLTDVMASTALPLAMTKAPAEVPASVPSRASVNELPAGKVSAFANSFQQFMNGQTFNYHGKTLYTEEGRNMLVSADAVTNKPGWRVQIAVRTDDAQKIAKALLPEIRKKGWTHKVVYDLKAYHAELISGQPGAGKFIELYPSSTKEAEIITDFLREKMDAIGLKAEDFPTILGEIEFAPGIFVRYVGE